MDYGGVASGGMAEDDLDYLKLIFGDPDAPKPQGVIQAYGGESVCHGIASGPVLLNARVPRQLVRPNRHQRRAAKARKGR